MLCGSQGGSTHLDFSNLLVIGKYYIFVMHQLVILGRYVIFKSLLILIPKKHVSASLGKMWFSHIDLGRANQNNRPNNISWRKKIINFSNLWIDFSIYTFWKIMDVQRKCLAYLFYSNIDQSPLSKIMFLVHLVIRFD